MEDKIKKLEEKVTVLQNKVNRLEKAERKRKISKAIKLIIKLILLGAIIIGIYKGYTYVNEKYIKPYKNTIDELSEKYDELKKLDISKLFKKDN